MQLAVGFIDVPTEQTTAITDAVLAITALFGLMVLRRPMSVDPAKVRIWSWAFGLMASSAALGAAVHGFTMPPGLKESLWVPLYLTLGLTVSLFPVAAAHDLWGPYAVRRAMAVMTSLAALFFVLTGLLPAGFLIFVLYSGAVLIFMIAAYGWLAVRRKAAGAALAAAGFLLAFLAGVVQAKKGIQVTLIWAFDHNGIYHLLLTAGLIAIIAGLRMGLCSSGKPGTL